MRPFIAKLLIPFRLHRRFGGHDQAAWSGPASMKGGVALFAPTDEPLAVLTLAAPHRKLQLVAVKSTCPNFCTPEVSGGSPPCEISYRGLKLPRFSAILGCFHLRRAADLPQVDRPWAASRSHDRVEHDGQLARLHDRPAAYLLLSSRMATEGSLDQEPQARSRSEPTPEQEFRKIDIRGSIPQIKTASRLSPM